MNNKKRIKNAFLDVNVSENLERNILNMTVNREVKKRKFKLAYLALIAVLVTGFSLSFVYAKEIKKAVQKIFSINVKMGDEEDSKVKINVDGITHPIPNTVKRSGTRIVEVEVYGPGGKQVMKDGKPLKEKHEDTISLNRTIEETEKDLGFPILKYNDQDQTEVIYDTDDNDDGTIARVSLWIPDFYEENGKECWMSVTILDDNADMRYNAALYGEVDVIGGKIDEEIYHTDNINGDIFIYGVDWDDSRLTAIFYHDGIEYTLGTNTLTRSEFKTILDNLKY